MKPPGLSMLEDSSDPVLVDNDPNNNSIENNDDDFTKNMEGLPVDDVDYRPQGGPRLTYLWCQEGSDPSCDAVLSGQTLYLGANVGVDGNVYCIPGHASQVLQINTQTDMVQRIGPPLLMGKFKWLRGVRVADTIYGLPCHADCVLKIHVPTLTVSTVSIPYDQCDDDSEAERTMEWKYHGGTRSPLDGCIYAIPQSAGRVLQIDPTNDTCRLVGPFFPGRYKWYGGIVGKSDGAIYGIPHNSKHVLRILPNDITLHGDFGEYGCHKWHGASAASNGCIVSVPANADSVLVITPAPSKELPPTLTVLDDTNVVKTGRHRSDSKYKYLGAMVGTDGNVYCFPSGSEYVLQVETEIISPGNTSVHLRNVGQNLFDMERIHQNKWQNGVKSENEQAVYGIPLAAESVLRISCEQNPQVTTWTLPFPNRGLAKWEGGVLHPTTGIIYCVPNNHKAVLRIESPLPARPVADTDHRNITSNGLSPLPVIDDEEMSSSTTRSKIVEETQNLVSPTLLPKGEENQDGLNIIRTDRSLLDGQPVDSILYRSGIPTLRSSAHRVKFSPNFRRHDPQPQDEGGHETSTTFLPPSLCQANVFPYDCRRYDLVHAIVHLLQQCDPDIVGMFRTDITKTTEQQPRLEDFVVPTKSLWRTVNGGQCESAQKYLSDRVADDVLFLELFDRLVCQVVLPHLKSELKKAGSRVAEKETVTFYYQRPPTLRLQPGPAWAQVKAHNDAEYGHQNGELNFWIPLTDRNIAQVDLYCESQYGKGDYAPIAAAVSEIISFHGSSCRHYVNSNTTAYTRVSMDFRVGVQGYFDPIWQMKGTTDDHGRRKIQI